MLSSQNAGTGVYFWVYDADDEAAGGLKNFCEFATALQHFLLLLQKETSPGGISIFPRSPLEPTTKTASVFLDLSREA